MKVLDIDEFLARNEFTIKLHGKEFKIRDISTEALEAMRQEEGRSEKEIVKKLLECKDEDLKGYGLAAFSKIIQEVTENLLQKPSQEEASSD